MVKEIQTLDIEKPPKVSYCIPLALRDEQIKHAISVVPGRIQKYEGLRDEPVAIVAFGPSLIDTWEEIKKFKYVISMSGSHKFLIERGIIPTWHTAVDPLPKNTPILIGQPHKDVEYLISSTCHPDVFEHLKGYNVKLWHVFATEDEGLRVLPPGEWCLTGGSDIGLRSLTIARFLGFTNFHIFGKDGSEGKPGQKHAGDHPGSNSQYCLTEYPVGSGKMWRTTPSMLHCAKETFHELDQLKDVKATFYGEGLVQAMAKDYVPKHVANKGLIAFIKPELISDEYRELNAKLHRENLKYGIYGDKHADKVLAIAESIKSKSILDYGCGKGTLARAIPFPIWEYDPAIPGKEMSPRPADLVVCTDVLEHIEPDKLDAVLMDLKRVTLKVAYLTISTRKAQKTLANGKNAHLIVKDKNWWEANLRRYFDIGSIAQVDDELHVVVGPKTNNPPELGPITTVTQGTTTVKFLTPNDTTKWRAETLLKKEPITIEWINQMKPGENMYDVGANVGGYTVWAGAKGVHVWAFEPEAENYALLVRNMQLNSQEPRALCLALGDKQQISMLHLSQRGAGGSCHSFDQAVGPTLEERATGLRQGCIGVTMDSMLRAGLPQPDHIKIDVDGFEFKVIEGATETLKKVKSLLVEVNTNLPQHQAMIKHLQGLGFTFDQAQVDRATRKDGPFKGCAEYVFSRVAAGTPEMLPVISTVELVQEPTTGLTDYLLERLAQVQVQDYPTPHICIQNVVPDELYKELLATFPEKYTPIEISRQLKGYPERFTAEEVCGPAWVELDKALRGGAFKKALCEKFGVQDWESLNDEILLIRDLPGYKIGPHTDARVKVISSLFYMPKDNSSANAGTTFYESKSGKTCPGGPHYGFEDFRKLKKIPFLPNTMMAFVKTDSSWHGVEPSQHTRDVLLYDIRRGKYED